MIPIVFTSLLNQYEASWETDDTLFNQPQDDLYSISQTPQVWLDHQVMERNGELHFNWDVVEQLFEPALMDQMFQCYCQLLHALAQRPQLWHETQDVLALPTVSAPVTQAPAPTALLHHGLLRQAALTPQETALISPIRELTYRQLSTAADHVARALLALGVQHGDRVAVVMEKAGSRLPPYTAFYDWVRSICQWIGATATASPAFADGGRGAGTSNAAGSHAIGAVAARADHRRRNAGHACCAVA